MENHTEQTEVTKKKKTNWLLWWQIDPEELTKQVTQYNSLKIWQSAKGMSVLCLSFSASITFFLILFSYMEKIAICDVLLILIISIFIYYGNRWAMIIAMIYWTCGKIYLMVHPSIQNSNPVPIVQIIWWATYMHPFYLAYRVEIERKK